MRVVKNGARPSQKRCNPPKHNTAPASIDEYSINSEWYMAIPLIRHVGGLIVRGLGITAAVTSHRFPLLATHYHMSCREISITQVTSMHDAEMVDGRC